MCRVTRLIILVYYLKTIRLQFARRLDEKKTFLNRIDKYKHIKNSIQVKKKN